MIFPEMEIDELRRLAEERWTHGKCNYTSGRISRRADRGIEGGMKRWKEGGIEEWIEGVIDGGTEGWIDECKDSSVKM